MSGPLRRKVKPEPALLVSLNREWRIVRDFPDYEISNDDRLRRVTAGSNTKVGAHIRVTLSNRYPRYGLTSPNGKRYHRNAHRLVAIAFLPSPPPGKPDVLHKDDNRLNCIDSNLKWGNGSDNWSDAVRNNLVAIGDRHPCKLKPWTRPRGEAHSSSKLTERDVKKILVDARSDSAIAADYEVDPALVYRIKRGQVWKHITNPKYRRMLEAGAGR